MRQDLINFFRVHDLTRGFSDSELIQLTDLLIVKDCRAGETIIEEGSKNDTFYFLYRGEADVLKYDQKSKKNYLISETKEGVLFGEMSIIGDEPASATVTAKTDCVFLLLSQDKVATHPVYSKLVINSARGVITRLRVLNAKHVKTLGEQIQERLIKERIETELRAARDVQMALLPDRCPDIEGYQIVSHCKPARDVGGDFFDFAPVDSGKTALILGDVSGKGMPAALLMAECRSVIRAQIYCGNDPRTDHILTRTNVMIFEDSEDYMFVTCFMGILDIASGRIQYCNAAHNPPYVYRRDSEIIDMLDPTGTVLGFSDKMTFDRAKTRLDPGDVMVIYSDGVTEAKNPDNELYGDDRLKRLLSQNSSASAQEIQDVILTDVEQFVAGAEQSDDITMMVIKRVLV
ncbi:MAG: SpoIIE family protein phosphatase [Candidatus Electryoneaceae bacterium]|nr:SpoIIE family protein phosphatase [Candidatus Electryoneaceae bacterium]